MKYSNHVHVPVCLVFKSCTCTRMFSIFPFIIIWFKNVILSKLVVQSRNKFWKHLRVNSETYTKSARLIDEQCWEPLVV